MENNLIICSTVLQSFIATQIAVQDNLNSETLDILYFTSFDNQINQLYYQNLCKLANRGAYLHINKKVFLYIPWIKKRFREKQYNTVYLASVDSILIYFILSNIKFKRIVTFDDGTANIVQTSIYYAPEKGIKNFFRNIVYILMGNRYSLRKVKKQIAKHFTIYPGMDNISSRTELLDLTYFFRKNQYTNSRTTNCIIILGTVFKDITNSIDEEKLKYLLQEFINTKSDMEIIYIPHPRDNSSFHNVTIDSRAILAEEKILDILKQHKTISLYGFCSSAQFNLMSCERINNYCFDSSLLLKKVENYINLAKKFNFSVIKLG